MEFKKIASIAASIVICAALFTACGNSSEGEAETTPSQTQSVTTASAQEEASDNVENTEASEETDSAGDNEADTNGEQDPSSSDSILSQAADAALADAPWPAMERLEDPEFVSDFFLLDMGNENYKDIIVLKCPMSANLSELIIIEADDVSAAQADLEARRTKAQEQDAWYPDDVEKAGASIVGTEGSYAYFIMGSEPASVESALTDYLRSNG